MTESEQELLQKAQRSMEAQELRLMGDYGQSGEITEEQADQQIERAQKFIELGQVFIVSNLET